MKRLFSFLTILILLTAGTAYAVPTGPYAVDANTVALYHFDEAAGGVTPDAVGNHPGTLYGDAFISSGGYFGGGLALDGIGDYVRLGNVHQNPPRDPSQGTVEAWVNLSGAPSSFVVLGSGTEYGSSWDDGWFLGRHGGYSGNLVFMMWSYGWWVADSGLTPESLVGAWHHLAGSWGPGGVQIWVDGVLKDTELINTGGLPNPNYSTALVGTDSWAWATPGMIDEVRISDIQRESFQPVPVPAAVWLLGSGLLGLAGFRKFRKS